ncbi:MAG: hypothetical protein F4Z17_12890, partial [Acidimicrobiia bacterium]|nr:hypothetical protein [Acidimicrobiia bacterium]
MITKTGLTSTPTGGAAFALACGTLAAVLLLLLAEFPTQVHAQTGSTDATLSSVTVDGVPVPGFVANRVRSDYGVASGVSQVTVAATTTHRVASWAITRPADADSRTDGHQVDLTAGRNVVRIEVTAEEGNTKAHWLRVNRGVDKEFGWKAGDDFDTLIAAGNGLPTGIWSDGTTMWVSDWEDTHMYAYDLDSGLRDKTREFDLKNGSPFGIWSDGETIWVVDNPDNRVYAYALSGGGRQKSRDIALHPDNRNPTGIWSDGETMWVGDHVDEHIYAYTLSGGARDDNREFGLHPLNYKVDGLWSNGTTMWVSDRQDDHIYAYTLSNGERDTEREFNTLLGAHNKNAVALWSDGKTMWVSDYHQDKIFSYNVGAGEDGGFAAVPTAPRSVAVESGGAGDLDVSWETPSRNGGSDITGYKVQWKQATGSWYTPADVSEATTTGTSHTITGLSPETEYTVRVIATSSVGDGPASAGAKGSAPQNTPATG